MVRKPDSDVRGPLVLYNFGGKGGGARRGLGGRGGEEAWGEG